MDTYGHLFDTSRDAIRDALETLFVAADSEALAANPRPDGVLRQFPNANQDAG